MRFTGLKEFVVDNNQKIIDKILYGMKKINKKDNKIGLISLEFSVEAYQSNSNRTIEKLFNEVFTLDIDENKKKVTYFAEENEINRD